MKNPTSNNIKIPESVKLTGEDFWEAEKIEGNPAAMLRLIDMIFGPGDYSGPPS